jgi:hypothetical protein
MATSGISSARKKLERAEFHLKPLQDEVETFRERVPYEFAMEQSGLEQVNGWTAPMPRVYVEALLLCTKGATARLGVRKSDTDLR